MTVEPGTAETAQREVVVALGPVLFAYDGSELAAFAIEQAGRQLATARDALVVCVWQPADVGFSPVEGQHFDAANATEVHQAAEETAAYGASLAETAGFRARALAVEAAPSWKGIVQTATRPQCQPHRDRLASPPRTGGAHGRQRGRGGGGPRRTPGPARAPASLNAEPPPWSSASARRGLQPSPTESSGTMSTGRRVCDASVCETLPSNAVRRAPRPRWPQTIKRAERSSALSRMALAIPSKDSLVIGEAWYPCSLARRAPSAAIDRA